MQFLEQYKGPFYHFNNCNKGYGFEKGCGQPFINDTVHMGVVDSIFNEFGALTRYQHNLIFKYEF